MPATALASSSPLTDVSAIVDPIVLIDREHHALLLRYAGRVQQTLSLCFCVIALVACTAEGTRQEAVAERHEERTMTPPSAAISADKIPVLDRSLPAEVQSATFAMG